MSNEDIGINKEGYTTERLSRIINNFNYFKKVIRRVYFIKYRYSGYSISDSAERAGVSVGTGYNWQKIWNNSNDKEDNELFKVGNFGGPKPKLSESDLDVLSELIKPIMAVKDVKNLIKDEFNVNFTEKHVRTSIMKKLKSRK